MTGRSEYTFVTHGCLGACVTDSLVGAFGLYGSSKPAAKARKCGVPKNGRLALFEVVLQDRFA